MRIRGGRSDQELEDWIKTRIKEGYGQGYFEDYKAWINHHSFSSLGRNGTVHGNKVKRDFELFSDLERNYFYILDYSNRIEDIHEQYPLLDRKLMYEVAHDLGVKPPRYVGSNVLYVMTTDFHLLIEDDHGKREAVRTVKYSHELKKPRVQEKLNIERNYFKKKGIFDWKIITEETINPVVVDNIRFFRGHFYLDSIAELLNKAPSEMRTIVNNFKKLIPESPVTIHEFCQTFDRDFGIGSGINVFKHLLATKEINLDLTVPLGKESLITKERSKIRIVNRNYLLQ